MVKTFASNSSLSNRKKILIREVFVHDNYTNDNDEHDVALLRLGDL